MSAILAPASILVEYPALFSLPAQRLDLYLEQVHAPNCKTAAFPPILAIHSERKIAVFYKPRCKLWTCSTCSQINQRLWTWRAVHGCRVLMADSPIDFVTLTSHERLDAAGSIAVLPKAWKTLHMRLKRAAPGVEYLIVPEGHKNGRVHLHMLTTANLKKRWWKDNARACGMGYQSDVQQVRSDGSVAAYTSKYLGKSLQFPNFAKGFHRVRTSRGWPPLPEPELPAGWMQIALRPGATIDQEWHALLGLGYRVQVTDYNLAWHIIKATN